MERKLNVPIKDEKLNELKAGDVVYLTGNILTEYNFTRMDSKSDGNRIYDDKFHRRYQGHQCQG